MNQPWNVPVDRVYQQENSNDDNYKSKWCVVTHIFTPLTINPYGEDEIPLTVPLVADAGMLAFTSAPPLPAGVGATANFTLIHWNAP
jgi:hypothetical protein